MYHHIIIRISHLRGGNEKFVSWQKNKNTKYYTVSHSQDAQSKPDSNIETLSKKMTAAVIIT